MQRTTLAGRRAAGGLLLLAAALVLGCGGGDATGTSGDYYMRFQTPSGQVNFTTQGSLVAAFAQSGNQRTMLATGIGTNSNISITIFDGAAITTKTYSGYDINQQLGALVGVQITYQDAAGVVYSLGQGVSNQTVTITGLTATTVTGTFSGTVKSAGHADLAITGGQFFVLRAN